MAELPEAHVVHLTPRRLRIKVPARRHDPAFFNAVKQRLAELDAVRGVEVNPATGSILVHSSDSRALLQALESDSPFVVVERLSEQAPSLESVRRQLTNWETQIRRWTGMRDDVRVYIFFALVLSAAYQLKRGNIFAPAATLVWYASEALRVWSPKEKTERSAGT